MTLRFSIFSYSTVLFSYRDSYHGWQYTPLQKTYLLYRYSDHGNHFYHFCIYSSHVPVLSQILGHTLYQLTSKQANTLVYTDKFIISVVNLKCIDAANELDKKFKLDKWARLFTAQTWEELREIAKGDSYMEATARKLFALSADFDIQEEARRRKEYYQYVEKLEREIQEKEARIAELETQLAKLK